MDNMIIDEQVLELLNLYLRKEIPKLLPKTVGSIYVDSEFHNDNLLISLDNAYLTRKVDTLSLAKYYQNIRETVISNVGFSLLTWEWIDILANRLKNKRCLEICAGVGALSYALKEKGIDVICTNLRDKDYPLKYNDTWTHVEEMDCIEAIKTYGSTVDYIIASWFPSNRLISINCLLEMRKFKHLKMIYIGGMKSWVSDNIFFEELEIVSDFDIFKVNQFYPNWSNINDYLMLIK